ncbi:glycosyl hydrolase family 32 [Kiritimatiella glycovorans]|uniref:Glycosyl hydrolase family 32 N-terminal domain-containing protein n=1 Tax=Kiritimatiella glycovorans TaxID=1307763 RepID=A0A0G3EG05_9BACT|nr:glycosyl hydrolase family 32 [Kiritimatiella glycovorans]AKJ65366.1 hypothetical protein L21SP4_02135 [Kiritimatiella glycovorans]
MLMRISLLITGVLLAAVPGAAAFGAALTGAPGAVIEVRGDFDPATGVAVFEPGAVIFTDRNYTVAECPDRLRGLKFLRNPISSDSIVVAEDGLLFALTPESDAYNSARYEELEARGFARVENPGLFQLFGDMSANRVRIYRKAVKVGERYDFSKWTVLLGFRSAVAWQRPSWEDNRGEMLYNGIRLPEEWPPSYVDPRSTDPMPVPYLDHPPAVVAIDLGRQLFVDDFLIEDTDLERTFHYPEKYAGNPVLEPQNDLEAGPGNGLAVASPKSGGLWWNPEREIFELWYEAGWLGTVCYATSTNGIDWHRPELDILPGYNQVIPMGLRPDSWTVVRDWWTDDPDARYKIFVREPGGGMELGAMCFTSPDGIHWGEFDRSGPTGDRSTMFYNPFRKKWVFSIRSAFRGRSRHYWEADRFIEGNDWDQAEYRTGLNWQPGQPVVWAGADRLDPPDPEVGMTPQLYNLDAVAYESLMLGFFQIWRGPHNHQCEGAPKITELNFAYSRDGFHWHRPDRTTAIRAEREAGNWDRGYVQSLGNICVVRGDELWFYYTGFAGNEDRAGEGGMYDNGAMGIAKLRRDGFVSMDAGEVPATLTTRPVRFDEGCRLFVNADVPEGDVRAEILDAGGEPIPPFTLANSEAFRGDETLREMTWAGAEDFRALRGQAVRFRFTVTDGALYAFWVSPDDGGRSDGFLAGSGPGYTGPTDTVGAAGRPSD